MKIILTGTSGFIGGSVANHFLHKGEQVRSIPRDMLYDRWDLQKYLEAEQPDVILHFAAYGNHSAQTELGSIVEANIHCTLNLLEASKNVPYSAFVNTSTSSVLLPKQTHYSASKMATEYFCKAFVDQYNKPIVSVRPFSIFGEREAPHRFIPTVIRNAKEGNVFNLVPDACHDWTYIDDFIAGIETVIANIQQLKGQSVNIGTGQQFSNLEVVEKIERIHGTKILYTITRDMRNYDTDKWVAENSLLKLLGWKQKYSLTEGLQRTYDLAQ